MAKLTAPLFSLDASGTIAKAITFSRWKGIKYARTRVIPANPQSIAQTEVRAIFTMLSEMWKRLPYGCRTPWMHAVRGLPLTDRNKHVQLNVPVLQGEEDLDKLVMSVSTGQAVPPATMTPSDAGGQVLTIAATAPSVPPGYTLTNIRMAAVLQGVPDAGLTPITFYNYDAAAPYTADLPVGVAGTYQCAAWCHFNRDSDGLGFSSAALRATQVIA